MKIQHDTHLSNVIRNTSSISWETSRTCCASLLTSGGVALMSMSVKHKTAHSPLQAMDALYELGESQRIKVHDKMAQINF